MAVNWYVELPKGAKLRLWYQRIDGDTNKPSVKDPDHTFENLPATEPVPDVEIVGGDGTVHAKITVMNKRLTDWEESHKGPTPFLRKHEADLGGAGSMSRMRRYFRIGQWRIVDSRGNVVRDVVTNLPFEGNVEMDNVENYRFYPIFGDYQ
jgi:hypothetical protein